VKSPAEVRAFIQCLHGTAGTGLPPPRRHSSPN
jgi:hypothetical protein